MVTVGRDDFLPGKNLFVGFSIMHKYTYLYTFTCMFNVCVYIQGTFSLIIEAWQHQELNQQPVHQQQLEEIRRNGNTWIPFFCLLLLFLSFCLTHLLYFTSCLHTYIHMHSQPASQSASQHIQPGRQADRQTHTYNSTAVARTW